ncbi:DUF6493 family protein [Nonomuraea sp. NPDC026600]|uniref:DUF7824 domain-containing protein n=1 Tax=Nonomuraea sp. NPDC026600 TaxID=3155363 RepID=UPI0033C8C2B5
MSGWERVAEAVGAGDASRSADEVLRLDTAGCREVARRLPRHIGSARQATHERFDRLREQATAEEQQGRKTFIAAEVARGLSEEEAFHRWWSTGSYHAHHRDVDWTMRDDWIAPMMVAGAGTLGGAAAVATWIFRRDFAGRNGGLPVEPLLRVIAARPPEWQADLAVRVAGRLRGTPRGWGDGTVALALELLRRTGAPLPDHEPLVAAWVSTTPDLEGDPLAEHLIPRLFEAEGVGRVLRDDRGEEGQGGRRSWLHALRDLADAGRVEREALVEGCVRRFLRGGSATDLRFFVRLHELLEPGHGPERVRDYLRLLPAAPGPVAELALRQLSGAGGLSGEDVNDAVAALLFRPEGKLVRAGLTLLDQAARAAGDDLDQLAPALASAFLCESYEVRERSVRLAVKHAGRFTPAGAEAVREAAGVLPPDLAACLAEAYGAAAVTPPSSADVGGFEAVGLPAFSAPSRRTFPGPIEDLAGDFDQFHHEYALDRWLDGFVRNPHNRKHPRRSTDLYTRQEWSNLADWTEALLREATDPGREPRLPARGTTVREREPSAREAKPHERLPHRELVSPSHWAMLLRCAEIHSALKEETLPPYLLATPTRISGHIDPAELADRIEGYQNAGVRPLPADLQQALLRLPREVDPEVSARAGRLARHSEAGAALERWLRQRPEPETRLEWPRADAPLGARGWPAPFPRAVVRLEPTGMALVDALLSDPPLMTWSVPGGNLASGPLVLPSDREAVAMQLVPHMVRSWQHPGYLHTYVTALCYQDGPAGEGMAFLFGMLLAERGWHAERCRELLLRAAAAKCLPAEECGRQLGLCLRRIGIPMSQVCAGLEDIARKGAHREAWAIMRGLLPVFLPGPGERGNAAHTRALELAVCLARWAEARGTIPEVAGIATRKGSSGLVRAARRLDEHLDRADQ